MLVGEREKNRHGDRVMELWTYLAIDSVDDCEGIAGITAILDGQRTVMPMIAADKARIASLRPVAQEMARREKVKLRLVRFVRAETTEEVE